MRKPDIAILIASVVFSLMVMEVMLRAFTIFPIHDNLNISPHSSLGHTLNPRLKDVNASGFRNPSDFDKANIDILAIGDSHTQGFNVSSEDSWPSVLARTVNRNVYNYGIGGYGFAHYAYLLDTDISDNANRIIVAIYPTNDVRPGICAKVSTEFYQTLLDKKLVTLPCLREYQPLRPPTKTIIEWLAKASAAVSIGKYIVDQNLVSENEYFTISGHRISKSRVRIRNRITDLSNTEVAHNFNATIQILAQANATKKHLGVMIIPSKDRVVRKWAHQNDKQIPNGFNTNNESKLISVFIRELGKAGIPVVDATPYVLDAFNTDSINNKLFYPANDGHPFESGYRAYAKAATEVLTLISKPH